MDNNIKELLKDKVMEWMNENSITWMNLQDTKELKKIKFPVSYGTIRSLIKKDEYTPTPRIQCELLKFFKVKHKRTFNKIELIENGKGL